jgi:hypothetical protein
MPSSLAADSSWLIKFLVGKMKPNAAVVLVIRDKKKSELMKSVLTRSLGLDVLTFESATEFQSALATRRLEKVIRLILLDDELPGWGGDLKDSHFSMIRSVRELHAVPVVVLGNQGSHSAQLSQDLGPIHQVSLSNFDVEEFVKKLKGILGYSSSY